jgi:hypothetical protein
MSYFTTSYEPYTDEELAKFEGAFAPLLVPRMLATIKAKDEEIAILKDAAKLRWANVDLSTNNRKAY